MDLLEELHRLSDDEKKLSLRSILWQKSNNPVHQTIAWFLDHSDTPNPIKNRLRKHSYQEEYAGYTLYELLRSLPPSDLPVDPQEVLDWLKDRSYIQQAFFYTRTNEGKLVTSLTAVGARDLLLKAGYVQFMLSKKDKTISREEQEENTNKKQRTS
jgi:hypothetical protein